MASHEAAIPLLYGRSFRRSLCFGLAWCTISGCTADDPDFVRAQLPGTRAVLDWFLQRQRPDGLLGKIPWWPFVDWGKDFAFGIPPQDKDGGSSIITLQFVEALRNAAEMESALGDKQSSRTLPQPLRIAQLPPSTISVGTQHYGLLADTPAEKHFSQHANILGSMA